jgi:thymidylate kinase
VSEQAVAEPAGGISTDARRALARVLLDALRSHGVQHAVLRDPDRLLEAGLGDLDLWISPPSLPAVCRLLRREANGQGWSVIKYVSRPYVRSLYLYRRGRDHSVLTVDLFPAIRWYVVDIVPSVQLRDAIREVEAPARMDTELEAAIPILHHLAWNGHVPDRYRARLRTVDRAGDPVRAMSFARWAAAAETPSDLGRIRRRLLGRAAGWTLRERPGGAIWDVVRTGASLVHGRPGRCLGVEGEGAESTSRRLVEDLKREHFLLGRWGRIESPPSEPGRRALWSVLVRLKRHLGATIVIADPVHVPFSDIRVVSARDAWIVEEGRTARAIDDRRDLTRAVIETLARPRVDGRRHRRREGMVVGLVGPDGTGKSTLAAALERDDRLAPIARFHWRPGILPSLARLAPGRRVLGEGQSPTTETHGRVASVARLSYYWLDTQLGFLTRWAPSRRRGGTILVERTFIDVGADARRYAFDLPVRLVEAAVRLSFKPDLLIVMSVPGDVAHRRKGELPANEVERQLEWWGRRATEFADTRFIDASMPIDALADRVVDIITSAK